MSEPALQIESSCSLGLERGLAKLTQTYCEQNRLFLVLGPESSGTRLLTRILIRGGCVGNSSHRQTWDDFSWRDEINVVWRRSVPHDGRQLNLPGLLECVEADRVVEVLVIVRDITATASSQVRIGHSPNLETAHLRISSAYESIFSQLAHAGIGYIIVPYESLVLHPRSTQKALWDLLHLPGGEPLRVTDENAKHYEPEKDLDAFDTRDVHSGIMPRRDC